MDSQHFVGMLTKMDKARKYIERSDDHVSRQKRRRTGSGKFDIEFYFKVRK